MKNLTVYDLAKILQLDNRIQEKLRKEYNGYNANLQYDILNILWNGVFELKTRLAKNKYELFLQEVDEGKRELNSNLYQEAVKAVWKDFENILAGYNKMEETQQIQEAREKLQSSLTSIQDSSKTSN